MGRPGHRAGLELPLAFCLLLLAPAAALAQAGKPPASKPPATSPSAGPANSPASKPDPARLAEAKKHYDRGIKLFKEGLFREALAAFLQARELSPRESIQRNIAQSYRELKDLPRAHDAYVELLDTFGPSLRPRDAEQIKQVIDELRQLTASVELVVNERDALVQIDGARVGPTPLARPVRLATGAHKIAVTRDGFLPFQTELELRGGEAQRLDVKLAPEPTTGHLVITTEGGSAPATTVLLVDGNEVGPLPWEGDVAPGPHQLEIKGPGVTMAPRRIAVLRGIRSEVTLPIERTTARVIVEVLPAQARIQVDDRAAGVGAWDGSLPEGRHTIAIVLEGHETYTQALVLRGGETRELRGLVLRPLPPDDEPPRPVSHVYSRLLAFGRFSSTQTQEYSGACAVVDLGGSCDKATSPVGGGAGLQIGYSFKYVGLEGFALATYDQRRSAATFARDVTATESDTYFGAARTEDLTIHRYGGMLGLGARTFTEHDTVRFTLGLGAGVSVQQSFYRMNQASVATERPFSQSFSSDTQTHLAPMLMLDGGIMLGSTPGAKFYLGGMLMLEFLAGSKSASAADAKYNNFTELPTTGDKVPLGNRRRLEEGTQIFFGPVLGGQFGR